MVSLANTNINGRYIFSGDTDQTAPYTFDPTQNDPVSAYQGAASTRVAMAPDGTTFPLALTAQQIFDSSDPATNAFTAINGLVTALNNNDQAGDSDRGKRAFEQFPSISTSNWRFTETRKIM